MRTLVLPGYLRSLLRQLLSKYILALEGQHGPGFVNERRNRRVRRLRNFSLKTC